MPVMMLAGMKNAGVQDRIATTAKSNPRPMICSGQDPYPVGDPFKPGNISMARYQAPMTINNKANDILPRFGFILTLCHLFYGYIIHG